VNEAAFAHKWVHGKTLFCNNETARRANSALLKVLEASFGRAKRHCWAELPIRQLRCRRSDGRAI